MSSIAHLLQLIASGTIMWFGLLAGGGVLAYLVLRFPPIANLLMWPFRALWSLLASTKLGKWLYETRVWKWLEAKEYDPPAKPLSTWMLRGALVLWLVGVLMAMAYWHGRRESVQIAGMPVSLLGQEYVHKGIESAWKKRALDCEKPAIEPAKGPAPQVLPPINVVIPTALPPKAASTAPTIASKAKVKKSKPKKEWYDF